MKLAVTVPAPLTRAFVVPEEVLSNVTLPVLVQDKN